MPLAQRTGCSRWICPTVSPRALASIVDLVRNGTLGRIYAIDMIFHNAYGPDKPWFYDRALSGGGCVMDLGVHLVDLALWTMDFPALRGDVTAALFANGEPLEANDGAVEDYAVASFSLAGGQIVRVACSWRLHAGQEAEISASFYGTKGGAALRNVRGSFYDFTAEQYRGIHRETLTMPPDEWAGRAAVNWVRQLAAGERFDTAAERLITIADVLDQIYATV